MAGFAAPPFHPILTDAGGGAHLHDARDHNAFDRYRRRVLEDGIYSDRGRLRRLVGVHRVTSIHVRTRYFIFLTVATSCMFGDERRDRFPLVPPRSCPRNIPHGFRNVASTPSRFGIRYHSRRARGVLLGGGKMFASPQSPTTG